MRPMLRLALFVSMASLSGWRGAGATALAAGRQTMTFIPGDRSRPATLVTPGSGRRASAAPVHAPAKGRIARRSQEGDETPAATARPGQGFTLEDGVLTYPAPARFQPQKQKPR
ncbi:hypothetical protein [Lichenifustis flavocetrariae]|uniref:Uncharacterized protein n=1 Tax=Lichenifustis flavocetrariae TaxID=2949735 RepID=A0AA42CM64_9HYPH|nr:hypothetical protein [Lichenifustis flavocetrariae]MCW6508072.1 hypothetical protein [Lichenifustis flavocetrariae]